MFQYNQLKQIYNFNFNVESKPAIFTMPAKNLTHCKKKKKVSPKRCRYVWMTIIKIRLFHIYFYFFISSYNGVNGKNNVKVIKFLL